MITNQQILSHPERMFHTGNHGLINQFLHLMPWVALARSGKWSAVTCTACHTRATQTSAVHAGSFLSQTNCRPRAPHYYLSRFKA